MYMACCVRSGKELAAQGPGVILQAHLAQSAERRAPPGRGFEHDGGCDSPRVLTRNLSGQNGNKTRAQK